MFLVTEEVSLTERPSSTRVELPADVVDSSPDRSQSSARLVLGALVVCALLVGLAVTVGSRPRDRPTAGAGELRRLMASVGGLQVASIGSAVGAFDLVTFDPLGNDRLIAVHRDSYGPAENQTLNQMWDLTGAGVDQQVWNPTTSHDYAHFNADGTVTMWVNGDDQVGFAPRVAVVLDGAGEATHVTPAVFASRSVTVAGTVFALTGSPDYFESDEPYRSLVAFTDQGSRTLSSAENVAWISVEADAVIAFPDDESGRTAVWDVATLERADEHPLAARSFTRAAVSGDGRTAVGIGFDGHMVQIDMGTGAVLSTFGLLDPAAVDRPIELDHEGRLAVTVDATGEVAVWYVGDDAPVASVDGDIAPTRWVHEQRASLSATAIAPDASRIALRLPATPDTEVRWEIIETNEAAWRARRG